MANNTEHPLRKLPDNILPWVISHSIVASLGLLPVPHLANMVKDLRLVNLVRLRLASMHRLKHTSKHPQDHPHRPVSVTLPAKCQM
jgi:hypothetical protein